MHNIREEGVSKVQVPLNGSLPNAVAIAFVKGLSSCIPGMKELEKANFAIVPMPDVQRESVTVVAKPRALHLALKLGSLSVTDIATMLRQGSNSK